MTFKAVAVADARLVEQVRACGELTSALKTEVATWKEMLRETVESLKPAEKPAE